MGRFVAEIEAFRERTMQRADMLVRKIALDTFKKCNLKRLSIAGSCVGVGQSRWEKHHLYLMVLMK